jgi:hypothetical protein
MACRSKQMVIICFISGFNFIIYRKPFDLQAREGMVMCEMDNSRGRGLAESTFSSMCGDAVEMNSP